MCQWKPWEEVPRDGTPIIVLLPNSRCYDCSYHDGLDLPWVGLDRASPVFDEDKKKPQGWIPFPEMEW